MTDIEPVPAPPSYSTFEYEYVELPSNAARDEILNLLNAQGAEGWEVVGFSSTEGFHRILMERESP
jgi:hypothetical protein